jgi:hypothetical protein
MESRLVLKYGQLQLKSFSVEIGKEAGAITRLQAKIGDRVISAKAQQEGRSVLVTFAERITIKENETLELRLS